MKKISIKAILLLLFVIGLGFIGWLFYRSMPDVTDKLFMAIVDNNIREMKKFIDQGADINAERGSKTLETPLIKAINKGRPKMVNLLLNRGANPIKSADEHNPLDVSISIALGQTTERFGGSGLSWRRVRQNQKKIIPLLITAHASTTYPDIILAILTNNFNLVKKLSKQSKDAIKEDLKKKFDILHPTIFYRDAILRATIFSGNKKMINYVFKNILEYTPAMKTSMPLQVAIENGNHDTIDYILKLPITDINALTESGETPLHTAVSYPYWKGDKKSVKKLLEMGANPNAQNTRGQTALDIVQHRDDQDEIIKLLLEYGAISMIKDNEEKTA